MKFLIVLVSLLLNLAVAVAPDRSLTPPPGYVAQDSPFAWENIAVSGDGNIVCVANKFDQPTGTTVVYRRGKFNAILRPTLISTYEAGICTVSADGSTIVQGAPLESGFVTVWKAQGANWNYQQTIVAANSTRLGTKIAVSSDGSVVAASEKGFRVWITGSVNPVEVPSAEITSLALSGDGVSALVVTGPLGVWTFSKVGGIWIQNIPAMPEVPAFQMAMDGPGTTMITTDSPFTSRIAIFTRSTLYSPWQVALNFVVGCTNVRSVSVSDGGIVVINCFSTNSVWIYKKQNGLFQYDSQNILPMGLYTSKSSVISADGSKLFIAAFDPTNMATGYVIPVIL